MVTLLNKRPNSGPPEQSQRTQIAAAPQPTCILCNSNGLELYSGLKDRLFDASGSWCAKRCPNKNCGLVWLDPMPLKDEIGKAYSTYYTHVSPENSTKPRLLRKLYRSIGERRWTKKVHLVYGTARGLLLDVGCGSGEGLIFFRHMGWQVRGLDFDENAVNAARQLGLNVECGSLEGQKFPDNTFDVVNLSHVIEHLPNPLGTLAECSRILKPGGRLVLFTPNSSSLGHRIFKRHWRGLEPPRHLHVFSMKSMALALATVGFREVSIYPQTALSVGYESVLLWLSGDLKCERSRRNWSAWLLGQLLAIFEDRIQRLKPDLVECLAAVAIKE